MAKSKNHSNHNQAYKAHRNGLRKPSRVRWISTKGVRHQATANNVTGARFGAALWLRARRPRCPPPAAGRWRKMVAAGSRQVYTNHGSIVPAQTVSTNYGFKICT